MVLMWLVLASCVVLDASGLRNKRDDDIIEHFVQDIESENYSKAARKYLSLNNLIYMSQAIQSAYKTENIERITIFTEELPTLLLRAEALEALVEKINDVNQTLVDALFVGDYIENKYKGVSMDLQSEKVFSGIREMVTTIEPKAVSRWALQISENDLNEINQLTEKQHNIFSKYLEQLVDKVFRAEDIATANQLLRYSNSLPRISQSTRTIIRLFALIKAESYTMALALYLAKEIDILQRMDNFKNIDQSQKEGVENVMNELPDSIRGIARGDELCIRNVKTFKLLYVEGHYDDERDAVSANPNPGENLSTKWRIEEDGDEFRIKTSPNDDYLYAAGDIFAFTKEQRRVFTWRKSTKIFQGKWDLRNSDWRNNQFYIYNTHHKEYLNAEDSNLSASIVLSFAEALLNNKNPHLETSRSVFTRRGEGMGANPEWKISYC